MISTFNSTAKLVAEYVQIQQDLFSKLSGNPVRVSGKAINKEDHSHIYKRVCPCLFKTRIRELKQNTSRALLCMQYERSKELNLLMPGEAILHLRRVHVPSLHRGRGWRCGFWAASTMAEHQSLEVFMCVCLCVSVHYKTHQRLLLHEAS